MNREQFCEAVQLLFGSAKKMSSATGINLRSIRRWSSGGAPVPKTVVALLRQRLFERVASGWDLLCKTDPAAGAIYSVRVPINDGDTDTKEIVLAVAQRAFIRANATLEDFERRYDPSRCCWLWVGWGNEARASETAAEPAR